MHLTVLGTSAIYPEEGRACSGYLLREGETSLLLDCGTGVFQNLRAYSTLRDLTAIVITHLHPDHFLDLLPLRQALLFDRRLQGVRPLLYLPPGAPEALEGFMAALRPRREPYWNLFDVREYDPKAKLSFPNVHLEFAQVQHPIPTYAIAATGDRRFVYSADSAPCPALVGLAQDADLFLCEATFVGDEPHLVPGVHITPQEAGDMARQAKVKRLVLTHLVPGTDRARALELAWKAYGNPVVVAEEHQVLLL